MTLLTPALTGFATAFSLILAIGAQNAFVLRQGLRPPTLGCKQALDSQRHVLKTSCCVQPWRYREAKIGGRNTILLPTGNIDQCTNARVATVLANTRQTLGDENAIVMI